MCNTNNFWHDHTLKFVKQMKRPTYSLLTFFPSCSLTLDPFLVQASTVNRMPLLSTYNGMLAPKFLYTSHLALRPPSQVAAEARLMAFFRPGSVNMVTVGPHGSCAWTATPPVVLRFISLGALSLHVGQLVARWAALGSVAPAPLAIWAVTDGLPVRMKFPYILRKARAKSLDWLGVCGLK